MEDNPLQMLSCGSSTYADGDSPPSLLSTAAVYPTTDLSRAGGAGEGCVRAGWWELDVWHRAMLQHSLGDWRKQGGTNKNTSKE